MPQTATARVVSSQELALLTARPETRILFICIATAMAGVAHGLIAGWDARALELIAGSAGAVAGPLVFGRTLLRKDPSAGAVSALAGLIPYGFGCYLVHIMGLWDGRTLLESFPAGRLVALIAFVYFGYRLVYWPRQLSEVGEALRAGKLIVLEHGQHDAAAKGLTSHAQ